MIKNGLDYKFNVEKKKISLTILKAPFGMRRLSISMIIRQMKVLL